MEPGEPISRTRLARLMRQQGLEVKTQRRPLATTDSHHSRAVAENRLERNSTVGKPGTSAVGDITFIPTQQGGLYLAVLNDLYSGKVVGWALSDCMRAELADTALKMKFWNRHRLPRLIVHHDRGSHYASALYRQRLKAHGFILSMSRRGNCWDNAPAESLSHTLKTELTHHRRYRSR